MKLFVLPLFLTIILTLSTASAEEKNGTLVINTTTPDVKIFINGDEMAITDSKGQQELKLAPGRHNIRFHKLTENGHFAIQGEYPVEIEAEKSKIMHFVLQREPTPAYLEWIKNQDNDSKEAKLNNIKTWLENEFISIPSGCFQMGDNDHEIEESPRHEVCLDDFSIGKTEVTLEQWRWVQPKRLFREIPKDHPIINVSWLKVDAFIKRLNQLIKVNKLANVTVRLPTESEWEYAARAGTQTQYSFGDNPAELGKYAWFQENAEFDAHQVAQKQPNPWGLFDMHGNVYEWVSDWFGPYSAAKEHNPQGVSSGQARIIRGGDYGGDASYSRSARRMMGLPTSQGRHVGFRLVIEKKSE